MRLRAAGIALLLLAAGCSSSNSHSSLSAAAKADLASAEIAVNSCLTEDAALPQSAYGGPGQPVALQCGAGPKTITVSTGNSLSYSNNGTSYSLAVTTSAKQTFTYDSRTNKIQGP